MEEIRRRSTSVRQLELLINYMEGHRDLALGRVRSREARAVANRHWQHIAEILNSEGNRRTPREWSKFWNDYKCRVRAKTVQINRSHSGTGGGPNMALELSPLENQVASLIGRDVGPLSGVRIDPVMDVEVINADNIPAGEIAIEPPNASPALDISNFILETRAITPPLPESSIAPVIVNNEEMDARPPEAQRTSHDQHSTQSGQTARSVRTDERRGRRGRVRSRSNLRSNTTDLDEARASIARIEEMRARTEATQADIQLVWARNQERLLELGFQLVNIMENIAQSIRLAAEAYSNSRN